MNCIYENYIKFVENFLTNYYRLLLDSKYEKKLVRPFIDKYIRVRYYNDCVANEKKFTTRLNKELNSVARDMISENEDKKENIKNIFALFSYVLFIEKCNSFAKLSSILKSLFYDKNITLEYTEAIKQKVSDLTRNYIKKRSEFLSLFDSNDFNLIYVYCEKDVILVDLVQDCNISKLYSTYAIEKAYNSELVIENRVYLEILLLSSKIIKDVYNLNYTGVYVIDFPGSLFEKSKKIMKYLNTLDNDYIKSKICLKVKYKDYKNYKKEIHNLINNGYSLSLELDETYDIDFNNLVLFSYIFVSKRYKYYDIIISSKSEIKTQVISL